MISYVQGRAAVDLDSLLISQIELSTRADLAERLGVRI